MFGHFCTRVARKLRRLGYARKVASRFAKIFQVMMVLACGLMGLFFILPRELFAPIAPAGNMHAGTRYGLFLPARSLIRR